MRLLLLTLLTLTALSANSLLNRLGVDRYGMDPGVFAALRVAAGVAMLWGLLLVRGATWPAGGWAWRFAAGGALALYMVGFSLAFVTLDAGVGTLILFGTVQVMMTVGGILGGETLSRRRYAGAGLALIGLAVLVWPSGAVSLPMQGVVLILASGIGWGIYSLMGRFETIPLAATAANFLLCLPMVLPFAVVADVPGLSWPGITAALLAGAVTSGLGYVLFYSVLPQLGASRAGVAQLSVPVIAALGGWLVLGEGVDLRFAASAVLVLGGIGWSLWPGRSV